MNKLLRDDRIFNDNNRTVFKYFFLNYNVKNEKRKKYSIELTVHCCAV